jgi:hypothetical protein
VSEPEVVVYDDESWGQVSQHGIRSAYRRWDLRRTAGKQEGRLRQLDDREATQVLRIHAMADDAESAQTEGEAVDEEQEHLDADDAVDELCEQLLGEDGVLFDELREVV